MTMEKSGLSATSFYSFFLRLRSYGSKTAFLTASGGIGYGQFAKDICRASQVMTSIGQKIVLAVSDKYNFAVAFFAVLLSGNTACLFPSGEVPEGFDPHAVCDSRLTDGILKKALTSAAAELNYRPSAEIAVIICSSGTTMRPKAIALSEENIMSDLLAGAEEFEYNQEDVLLNILPYTHIFGLICDLCAPLYCGSTLSFSYDLGDFLSLLPKVRPTTLHLAPGIAGLLLKRLERTESRAAVVGNRLRRIMSGGAGTSAELCLAMKPYQIEVFGSYGLTECSCGVCVCSHKNNRIGSVGRPLSCNCVHIGKDGNIRVTGKNVMLGYISGKGELERLEEQSFETGDLGFLDEDGFLFITGRADDLILFSDGKKLMPQRAEQALNELPGVAESMVHSSQDDRIEAVVYLEDPAQIEQVKECAYKLDFDGHRLDTVFFSEEPLKKTGSGKLNRSMYDKRKT